MNFQLLLRSINSNKVPVFNQTDRSSHLSFRSYMADDQAMGAAGKAPIGDKPHRLTEPLAYNRSGDCYHFPHARATFRALGACAHYISRPQLLFLDALKGSA